MDALSYDLKNMCRSNRDGSYATQSDRHRMLQAMAADLLELGFKLPAAKSLKPKHVIALVKRWQANEITTRSIKNRLAALRWWAMKIAKPGIVAQSNDQYGLSSEGHYKHRAKAFDWEAYEAIPCPYVKASLRLMITFGLRREEAIKFIPAWADLGDRIRLKPTWCKGGRSREISIVHQKQRDLLDELQQLAGKKSLIPHDKSYVEQLRTYEYQVIKAGLRNNHGYRHTWAQWRYKTLTGWPCPAAYGPCFAELSPKQKRKDRIARLKVSRELGHNRISITKTYLG